ncbi:hypothetical protein [Prescottella sp. R16]|uniref:hypothetical protein n=1 Tax=Prescottella sp. R16 TaxID=3064529 RepID=UPI00272EBA7A|nr:hypothetical protein [Prescottella sp. R16]
MTALALILVALTAVVGAIAGRLSAHGLLGAALAAVTALATAGAALAALAAPPVHGAALAATYVTAVVAAATGGAPMVLAAFRFARRQPDAGAGTNDGGPLRGGRVIGLLERTAVVVSILAGWPEGIAVVLAVKGLARYPELREPHASEQFIIGTFTSVLWAVAVAGVGQALIG